MQVALRANVLSLAVHARRRIGYMPENCPLYPEMRVDEVEAGLSSTLLFPLCETRGIL